MLSKVFAPDILMLLFLIFTLLWWSEFIIFPDRLKGKQDTGYSSLYLIMSAIIASIIIAVVFFLIDIGTIKGRSYRAIRLSAIAMYGIGIALRYWAIIALGNYFTRKVLANPDQELVNSGPYRTMRHPLYLGLLFLTMGVTCLIGNVIGIVATILLVGSALNVRMKEEELAMEHVIGDRYVKWKDTHYRFIPFLF